MLETICKTTIECKICEEQYVVTSNHILDGESMKYSPCPSCGNDVYEAKRTEVIK